MPGIHCLLYKRQLDKKPLSFLAFKLQVPNPTRRLVRVCPLVFPHSLLFIYCGGRSRLAEAPKGGSRVLEVDIGATVTQSQRTGGAGRCQGAAVGRCREVVEIEVVLNNLLCFDDYGHTVGKRIFRSTLLHCSRMNSQFCIMSGHP